LDAIENSCRQIPNATRSLEVIVTSTVGDKIAYLFFAKQQVERFKSGSYGMGWCEGQDARKI